MFEQSIYILRNFENFILCFKKYKRKNVGDKNQL